MNERLQAMLDQCQQEMNLSEDEYTELYQKCESDPAEAETLLRGLMHDDGIDATAIEQNGHYSTYAVIKTETYPNQIDRETGRPREVRVLRGFAVDRRTRGCRYKGTSGDWQHSAESMVNDALFRSEDDAEREALLLYETEQRRRQMARTPARRTHIVYWRCLPNTELTSPYQLQFKMTAEERIKLDAVLRACQQNGTNIAGKPVASMADAARYLLSLMPSDWQSKQNTGHEVKEMPDIVKIS